MCGICGFVGFTDDELIRSMTQTLAHRGPDGDALYFASEVKALLQARPYPSLRRDAVADFLTFLWVPDPDTMFAGVYKLPPGHAARLSDGRLSIWEYWDLSFGPPIESKRE